MYSCLRDGREDAVDVLGGVDPLQVDPFGGRSVEVVQVIDETRRDELVFYGTQTQRALGVV
jgi:hypothetical protein